MLKTVSYDVLDHVSKLIGARAGLRIGEREFPRLRQALIEVSRELGLPDASQLAPTHEAPERVDGTLQMVAAKLAIGETYFMRESDSLRAMCAMIQARAEQGNPVRVWSAGCSSGEEAYSIAIGLRERLRGLAGIDIRVLGTDIHELRIAKARRGVFARWSFRNAPPGFQSTYFTTTEEGQFAIREDIRRTVAFHTLNHNLQPLPSACLDGEPVDAIVCRNVLMYMTDDAVARALTHFARRIRAGSALVVSPAEAPLVRHPEFTRSDETPCIFIKKDSTVAWSDANFPATALVAMPTGWRPDFQQVAPDAETVAAGDHRSTLAAKPSAACTTQPAPGGLGERMDPASLYLRGCMLKERGELTHACRAFASAIYVKFDYPAAHFQLGLALRDLRHTAASRTYLHNAERLLRMREPNLVVDELAGLTAGRLAELAMRMAPEEGCDD